MSETTAQGQEAWVGSAVKSWYDADRLVGGFRNRLRRTETGMVAEMAPSLSSAWVLVRLQWGVRRASRGRASEYNTGKHDITH
jgi:hypothetical protein